MTTRKSQSIQEEKCEKPLSNNEMERLAQSLDNHNESYQEKPKRTTNEVKIDRKVDQANIDRPISLSDKTTIKPIVETNLKSEDLDALSIRLGEEIALIIVDEIVSQQSPKLLDTTREIA